MHVLVGVCARQHPEIFDAFLSSLFGLNGTGLELSYYFVFHNWDEGQGILAERTPTTAQVEVASYQTGHEYLTDERTHRWTRDLVQDVTNMRNMILRRALEMESDAVFMVDSDLLLHPQTLRRLCASGKDVIAEIFWTRWQPTDPELPNAWEVDQYGIGPEALRQWRKPGEYRVGGTGACTLIRTSAIRKGLSYSPVPSVSWVGEDRALQLRAAVLGIPIFIDTHYPAFHIYRLSLLPQGKRWYQTVQQRTRHGPEPAEAAVGEARAAEPTRGPSAELS